MTWRARRAIAQDGRQLRQPVAADHAHHRPARCRRRRRYTARPTSAAISAPASFRPSPIISTCRPCRLRGSRQTRACRRATDGSARPGPSRGTIGAIPCRCRPTPASADAARPVPRRVVDAGAGGCSQPHPAGLAVDRGPSDQPTARRSAVDGKAGWVRLTAAARPGIDDAADALAARHRLMLVSGDIGTESPHGCPCSAPTRTSSSRPTTNCESSTRRSGKAAAC